MIRTFDNDELRRRVDEVLYYVWDPIGVSDEPYARAEYESYVPDLLHLVASHNETEPISGYLAVIIESRMKLSPDKKKCDETAALLLRHKTAIQEGRA
jgi:hypothetical protein